MMNESKLPTIRRALRKGKKSGIFSGEIETKTIKFRYEIYGASYDKTWHSLSLNVRVYNCEYRSWVGSKWNKKNEGWRSTESINRSIRNEIHNEWRLFLTSTFDFPSYHLGVGNIKHMIQP